LKVVRITISKENYLKAILEAEAEGETVIAATLTRWLDVSAPAVTMAIRRLKRDGLITVRKSGQLGLTPAGRDIASRLLTRHQLIERMLTEIFGMEWYKVHDEAEQLEHAVSGDFERRLREKLGTVGFCPHGAPMGLESADQRRGRGWMLLTESPGAARVAVRNVFERDRELLEYLDRLAVKPGAKMDVVAQNVDETVTLRVAGKIVHLGRVAASKIWVEPVREGR
jgi:DtxR family Mn-dependent transcriptional regulator